MMEVVRTSETSIYYNETTRCNIPKSTNLHIHRRENVKSQCHLVQERHTVETKRTRSPRGSSDTQQSLASLNQEEEEEEEEE
jgi:hypothetical protein